MPRPPNNLRYPTISLPEAIVRLRALYDKEGTKPVDRDVISVAVGYTSRNGASDGVIAGMAHYGLLEDAGNRLLRITQLGLDIIFSEVGEPERANAIREAAGQPQLYSDLSNQFGGGKVSNRNLESYLVRKGFQPQSATKAIKVYRDTMEFVEQETRGLPSDTPRPSQEDVMQPQEPIVVQPQPASFRLDVTQNNPVVISDQSEWILPVDADTDVRLVFRGRLTDEQIDQLIHMLQFHKDGLQKRKQPKQDEPGTTDLDEGLHG